MRLGDTEVIVANYQDFVEISRYWQHDADISIFGEKIENFWGLSARRTFNNYT